MVKNRKIKIFLPILAIFITIAIIALTNIHPFLAADKPVDADILIFEGWIAGKDRALEEAIEEFNRGNYKFIITVGGPINYSSENTSGYNYAAMAADKLIKLGIDKDLVKAVPSPPVQKHKTFSMALAARIWLKNNNIHVNGVNVFTFGVHARKSQVVFSRVFEPGIKVGVISATPLHYNPKLWWLSKIGWKWVFYDSIKYIRALL